MSPGRVFASLVTLAVLLFGIMVLPELAAQSRRQSLVSNDSAAIQGVALVQKDRPSQGQGLENGQGKKNGLTTSSLEATTTVATTTPLVTTTVPPTTSVAPTTTTTLSTTSTTAAVTTTTKAVTTTTKPATTTTAVATTTTTKVTTTVPSGAVVVTPGTDLQALVNSNPVGTSFLLKSGTHRRLHIVPKDGNTFIGEPGTLLTGEGAVDFAFSGSAKNVTIRGLVIENYANAAQKGAIQSYGSGWRVIGNEIRYNAGAGVYFNATFWLESNYIHHNQQIGVLGYGTGSVVIDNEIAFNNYQDKYAMGWEAGGTKFIDTVSLLVADNYVHDNHGPALWTDANNYLTVYENNVVVGNFGPGILHEISYDAVIRNNRVEGNAFPFYRGGILVANSSNVEIYGNTLTGNDGGIIAIEDNRGSGFRGAWTVKNLWVHDNVIAYSTTESGVRDGVGNGAVYSAGANNRFDRNTYDVPNPASDSLWFWAGASRNWSSWKSFNQDANSTAG